MRSSDVQSPHDNSSGDRLKRQSRTDHDMSSPWQVDIRMLPPPIFQHRQRRANYAYFEGCPRQLGCSLVLRGASEEVLSFAAVDARLLYVAPSDLVCTISGCRP
jgi:hypothetical protein